jgi:hypothetical protein
MPAPTQLVGAGIDVFRIRVAALRDGHRSGNRYNSGKPLQENDLSLAP